MRLRWTEPAVHDLTEICDYIEVHRSAATARRVALSIFEGSSGLVEFPERGRPGRKPGTRELVFTGLPYVAIYRIRDRGRNPAYSSRRAELAAVKWFRAENRCANASA